MWTVLAVLLVILGILGIADGVFFIRHRSVIEPNVHEVYPNLNCMRLAILEIVAGVGFITFSVLSFL